jgi:hypothetical protein
MQCCMAATALTGVTGRAAAQALSTKDVGARREQQSVQITPDNVRFANYLHDLAGRSAVIGVVGGGLFAHIRDNPTGWNAGGDGLARQIASRAGQEVVNVSVHHGLAALMHRSTGYHPCDCHGFGPRVGHALLETFTDRRADGSRALSVPRLAGAYAGSMARLAWEPGHTPGELAKKTTFSLGFSALINIGRELSGVGR